MTEHLLLDWAESHGRDLPWRHTRDPWAVLVSEVMAQQTQVQRVIPKWLAFVERWPTPAACAAVSLGDVLRLWEGLGYPRRARNLHACAQAIAEQATFPDTLDALLALPGIGSYTARAVLAFAFERDVAVVDTNSARVLARWHGHRLGATEVQSAADAAVPPGLGWAWNQAMLDLGATLCTLRSPACDRCPVVSRCAYRGEGEDPARGTAGVSVAQSPFAGSDRQARGAILRAVARSPLHRTEVTAETRSDEERSQRLVDALLTEQLLVERDGVLFLP